jgi:hypothetical protein
MRSVQRLANLLPSQGATHVDGTLQQRYFVEVWAVLEVSPDEPERRAPKQHEGHVLTTQRVMINGILYFQSLSPGEEAGLNPGC